MFTTNREAAGVTPAMLRKCRTSAKQITTYAEGRAYVMIDQFTVSIGVEHFYSSIVDMRRP